MGKLPMSSTGIPVLDSRTCKPPPKTADAGLHDARHRRWRETVLERAGFRCEAVEADGTRCQAHAPRDRMFADHIVERRDGGAPFEAENGQCLCGKHHTLKTVRQRSKRMAG